MGAADLVERWPVGAAAHVVLAAGTGRAGSTTRAAGDLDRSFEWASVSKLCTALAVWVAVEEGTVALDDAAGPPGSTVAHLLAHASGLGPVGERRAEPGRRRIYSNAGYEVLARHLEARAAMPYAAYLAGAVFEPLGMAGATVAEGPVGASHGVAGTARDLAALGAELLAPTIVAASTLAAATEVAFGGLDGVLPGFGPQRPCDWGLGPEVRSHKHPHWTGAANSPRTFGHFGQCGCFLWVDPDAGVALAVLTDRTFGPWASAAWPAFSDAVLAELGAGAGDAAGSADGAGDAAAP